MLDLHNNITPAQAISPQNSTGDTPIVSSVIDRAGYESLEFVIQTGSLADAGATWAVTMDEDDAVGMGTASAVAAADVLGTLAGAGFDQSHDNAVRKVGYGGRKRYVRLTITSTGNAGNAFVSAVAILGNPRSIPKTSQS